MSSARSENTQTNVYLESTSLVWYVIGKSPGADSDLSGAFFSFVDVMWKWDWRTCLQRKSEKNNTSPLGDMCHFLCLSRHIQGRWHHTANYLIASAFKTLQRKLPCTGCPTTKWWRTSRIQNEKRDLNWAFVRQLTTQINFPWCRTSWWEEEL